MMPQAYRTLNLPLSIQDCTSLVCGDAVLLSGPLFMLRDAGHVRLIKELDASEYHDRPKLPYGLDGGVIFYAGPAPGWDDRPFSAVGPTTASRMDFAAPRLYHEGCRATIGKGVRSEAVRQACIKYGCVYFVATGGAAALLAQCVKSEEILAYPELGTEALRRIYVRDFPVFVGIDTLGRSIYDRDTFTTDHSGT